MVSNSHWAIGNQLGVELEEWLAAENPKKRFFRLKPQDTMRLLKLRSWSIRYGVPVSEILDLIVPILRSQIRQNKKYALGCTIATLTGRAAQSILEEQLRKHYPQGENWTMRRQEIMEEQLQAEQLEELDGLFPAEKTLSILDARSVKAFVARYNNSVMRLRKQFQSELSNAKRQRKNYRGNPWR